MSRSTAVLISAVITGFVMVIAITIAVGAPGVGASDESYSSEESNGELAALEETNSQAEPEAVIAEPTATAAPVVTAQPDAETLVAMQRAQDEIAELVALNNALQDRESIYRDRLDEANGVIQTISEPPPTQSPPNQQTLAAPADVPSDEQVAPGVTPTATATPTQESTPTAIPMIVEVFQGEELTGEIGVVASLEGASVVTSRYSFEKSAVVDWGDGTPLQPVTVIQETGEILAFHVYREPGFFVIFITAKVEGAEAENWTTIDIAEPAPTPTPVPDPTATPSPTATPVATASPTPSSTATPGQPSPLPPAAQPTGVTFEDAAYIARAISGELWIEKISLKTEEGILLFEVELDEAKVFINANTGVILYGEHILSSPVNPVPEPPSGMLTFDDAYSIAVTAHPGYINRISQSGSSYRVRVSGMEIRIDAYTGAIISGG